jgi:hypothetical protein
MGASAYYDSLDDALSASPAPAAGDILCFSHLHSNAEGATTTHTLPAGVILRSVDDSNADQVLAGARESVSTGNLVFNIGTSGGFVVCEEMDFGAEDDLNFSTLGAHYVFVGGRVANGESGVFTGDNIVISGDNGVFVEFRGVEVDSSDVADSVPILIRAGAKFSMVGGSFTLNTNKPGYLFKAGGSGGGVAEAIGVDLSNMASSFNIIDTNSASADDINDILLRNCRMPASWTMGEAPQSPGTIIRVENCDDGSNRSINAYRDSIGTAITNNSVYDGAADQVESQNASMEIITTADAQQLRPLRFKLGSVRADFSTAKTVTVQVAQDSIGSGTGSRCQNDEMWIEVHVPNSGNPGITIESGGLAKSTDTPTTNDSSSNTWTGPSMTTEVNEELSLTTTAGGGTGWADVYVCVAVPSITSGNCFVSHDIAVA